MTLENKIRTVKSEVDALNLSDREKLEVFKIVDMIADLKRENEKLESDYAELQEISEGLNKGWKTANEFINEVSEVVYMDTITDTKAIMKLERMIARYRKGR